MPFANNQGTKIYYEVVGQGSPIVLAHGLTGNITFWTDFDYVDKLKDKYSVILFDARGHGKSDKPHAPEQYDYRLMVNDVIAILDTLGISKTHYWGYSMGGFTGFGLAKHCPERLSSLIIGGMTPYANANKGEPGSLLKIFRRGAVQGVDAVVEGMRTWAGSLTPQFEERLRGIDPQAMVAYSEYSQYQRPGLENDALEIKIPCLLYAGEKDVAVHQYGQEIVQQKPNMRFYSLPGLGHVAGSNMADEIVPQALSFLNEVEKTSVV